MKILANTCPLCTGCRVTSEKLSHTHKGKREEASQGVSANNRPSKPHSIALTTSSHINKSAADCTQCIIYLKKIMTAFMDVKV